MGGCPLKRRRFEADAVVRLAVFQDKRVRGLELDKSGRTIKSRNDRGITFTEEEEMQLAQDAVSEARKHFPDYPPNDIVGLILFFWNSAALKLDRYHAAKDEDARREYARHVAGKIKEMAVLPDMAEDEIAELVFEA